MYTSPKRLYLTPEGAVSEEPVSGGRLLVPTGGELSPREAEHYGLLPGKQFSPPENKARSGKQGKATEPPADQE